MNRLLGAILTGLFLFSVSSYAHISRYYGPTFGKDREADCLAEADRIERQFEMIKHEVIQSGCVQMNQGGFRVTIDYDHPFGEDVRQFKRDFFSAMGCQEQVTTIGERFKEAKFSLISARCLSWKKRKKSQLRLDYVRTGNLSLREYNEGPFYSDLKACHAGRTEFDEVFRDNRIVPVLSHCQAYRFGMGEKVYFQLKYHVAIPLGLSIHTLRGKLVTDKSECRAGWEGFDKKDVEPKLLAKFCTRRAEKIMYQGATYLDQIHTRLRTHDGMQTTSRERCEADLADASSRLEKTKRKVIHGFCNPFKPGWPSKDRKVKYRFQVHYLAPKVVVKPKP